MTQPPTFAPRGAPRVRRARVTADRAPPAAAPAGPAALQATLGNLTAQQLIAPVTPVAGDVAVAELAGPEDPLAQPAVEGEEGAERPGGEDAARAGEQEGAEAAAGAEEAAGAEGAAEGPVASAAEATAEAGGVAAEGGAAPAAPPALPPPGAPTPEAWQAGVAQAAKAAAASIQLPGYSASVQAIRSRGFAAAATQRGARAGAEGLARTPRSGGGPARPPQPYDPVPEATRALQAVSDRELPQQTEPPLAAESPQGIRPQLGTRAVPAAAFRTLTSRGRAVLAELGPEDAETRQEFERYLEQLRPPEPEAAEPEAGTPAPAIPPEPRHPVVPLPEQAQADVGRLVAHLLGDADATVREVLSDVRKDAFKRNGAPTGILQTIAPTLGESEHLAPVRTEFEARMRSIATSTGMASETLDSTIEARRTELAQRRAGGQAEVAAAGEGAVTAIAQAGQAQLDAVAGTDAAARRHAAQLARAAARRPTRGEVPAAETRLIEETTKLEGDQDAGYREQVETRERRLEALKRDYGQAYTLAAQRDETKLRAEAGANQESRAVQDQIHASREWARTRTAASDRAIDELIAEVRRTVVTWRQEVTTAAQAKRDAIRTWADGRLGRQRTEDERRSQALADESAATEARSAAWRTRQDNRLAGSLARDMQLIRDIQADVAANKTQEQIAQERNLNAAQRAILEAYFTSDAPEEERGLEIVGATFRQRFSQEKKEGLTPQLEALALERFDQDRQKLTQIAQALNPGFDPISRASEVKEGVDHTWGTDEDRIFQALGGLQPIEVKVLRLTYNEEYAPRDMDADLEGDLSGREYERAQALLESNRGKANAIAARQAMYGNWEGWDLGLTGLGTDDDTLMQLSRDPEQAAEMDRAYHELYGGSLTDDAHGELEEQRTRERFDAQLAGNPDLADAIELRDRLPTPAQQDLARQTGNPPPLADRDAVRAIYDRIRAEVTARGSGEGWTTSEIEAEIARRNSRVESHFNERYGGEYGEGPERGLRQAFQTGFAHSPADQMLARGLADNDLAVVDTALVEHERRGVYSDDDAVNAVIDSQYRRALEATRRDQAYIRGLLVARRMTQLEAQSDRPWTAADRWAAEQRLRRQMDRAMESAAQGESRTSMDRFRSVYHQETGLDLDTVVLEETSDLGQWLVHGREWQREEARARLRNGGFLTPAQQVFFAIRGGGTREEALKDALRGRTAAEIEDIRREFRRLAPGEDMDAEIRSELSGRDAFDVDQLLKGTPETVAELVARREEAIQWELDNVGPVGSWFTGPEQDRMERELRELRDWEARMHDPNVSREQQLLDIASFEQQARSAELAVIEHRATLDRMVDRITTIGGIVVAVVVGALVSLIPGVGFVAAALIASLAATAFTMGTKAAVLGGAYGWEDIGVDLAVGVVDAVTAALTAGMGEKLLGIVKAGRGAGLAVVTRAVKPNALLQRLAARGPLSKGIATLLAEGVENVAANIPTAIAQSTLDDRNWEHGNPLRNIALGAATQLGTSVAGGAAFKLAHGAGARMFGGIGLGGRVRPPSDADIDAATRQAGPEPDAGVPRPPLPEPPRMGPVEAPPGPRRPLGDAPPELVGALPGRLRESVPVHVDPDLPGRTVQIEYVRGSRPGEIGEIRIVAGPDARPGDVLLHVPTLQTMRRYTGLMGRALNLRDDLLRLVLRDGPPQVGSRGWEAKLEVDKLPRVIESRVRELSARGADASERLRLMDEIQNLVRQLDFHRRAVTEMRDAPGLGFVAAKGKRVGPPPLKNPVPVPDRARLERYDVDDTPLLDSYPSTHRARQVGPTWLEPHGGRLREYRHVEIVGANGRVVDVREEIRLIHRRGWAQRGSWANIRGAVGEAASRIMSRGRMRSRNPDVSFHSVPQAHLQRGGGQGFDEVIIRFEPVGGRLEAQIKVIEVKNYRGDRYVPLGDFTAIQGKNLTRNMADLRRLVLRPDNPLGLTNGQIAALRRAFAGRAFEFEVRLSPTTRLGDPSLPQSRVHADLQAEIKKRYPNATLLPPVTLTTRMITAAERVVRAQWGVGTTPRYYSLATPPRGGAVEPARLAPARTATFAEAAGGGHVRGSLEPTARPDEFRDTSGGPLRVVDSGRPTRPADVRRTATETLAALNQTPARPRGAKGERRVLLDVTDVPAKRRAELIAALHARVRQGAPDLSRVLLVDRARRTIIPLTTKAKGAR